MSTNNEDTSVPRVPKPRKREWNEAGDITDAPLFLPTLPPLDTTLHLKNKANKRKSSAENLNSGNKSKKLKKRHSSGFDDFFIIERPASKETSKNGGKDEDISADWEIGGWTGQPRPENNDDKEWVTGSCPNHHESEKDEDNAILSQANTLQGEAKMTTETLESWEKWSDKAIKDTASYGNH